MSIKNFLTFAQLDSQCRKQAGDLSTNDINKAVRQNMVNLKIMKIYGVLDSLNDPFYNRSVALSINNGSDTSQEYFTDEDFGIDSASKTMSRLDGSFVNGTYAFVTITGSDGYIYRTWTALISNASGNSCSYSVVSGSDGDVQPGGIASITIFNLGLPGKSADVSSLYFKNFNAIYDYGFTSTPGQQIRVFDEITDQRVFFSRSLDYNNTKRPAWYQQGNTILFYVDSEANALGTVYGDYRGKPNLYTDASASDSIDIPPEFNQVLIDEVVSSYCVESGRQIPAETSERLASYEKKLYSAREAEKQTKAEKANQ